jgi:hypothetical protein
VTGTGFKGFEGRMIWMGREHDDIVPPLLMSGSIPQKK